MRSKPLIILGSLVFAAVLAIVACEEAAVQPTDLQDPAVTVDETRIPADGISSVEVTVTVLSEDNKKVENVPIDFTARSVADTSQDLGTLSQTSAVTDASGQATVTLTSIESTRDTTARVSATVGDTTGAGLQYNPKTGAMAPVAPPPPGAVVLVSTRPLDDEEPVPGRF